MIYMCFIVGSKDGFIRLWRRDDDTHTLVPVSEIPMVRVELKEKHFIESTFSVFYSIFPCKYISVYYSYIHLRYHIKQCIL